MSIVRTVIRKVDFGRRDGHGYGDTPPKIWILIAEQMWPNGSRTSFNVCHLGEREVAGLIAGDCGAAIEGTPPAIETAPMHFALRALRKLKMPEEAHWRLDIHGEDSVRSLAKLNTQQAVALQEGGLRLHVDHVGAQMLFDKFERRRKLAAERADEIRALLAPRPRPRREPDRLLVLVHPGSLMSSGRVQVPEEVFMRKLEGIRRDLAAARGLVVIDGALSDVLSNNFAASRLNEEISMALGRAVRAGDPALRVWGCDAGEAPPAGWTGFGASIPIVGDGPEDGAKRIAMHLRSKIGPSIDERLEIRVTGAWATRDDSSGCVNAAAAALRTALPRAKVEIAETALLEEDVDWEETPEPA